CRAGDGDGYQLELSVLGKDSWAQYDLVTGTPLGSVGPAGGYYSGWLNGGVHRLLDSGRATAN
ncbi:MAG: hypothetical protein IT196_18710, partial [Acidimicrobiales bacterium]|nr:hypothetical protein [Acidimicrobiales bacterium]